jgi:hypothetical protein
MKKLITLASAIFILALIVFAVKSLFASHETRIRRLILDMQSSFNEGDAFGLCSALAKDFQEADSGLGREEMVQILVALFHGERLPGGAFPHRAEIASGDAAGEALKIIVVEDARTGTPAARVQVSANFYRKSFKDGKLAAESKAGTIQFEGQLIQEDGRWKILKASHKLLEGRRPF